MNTKNSVMSGKKARKLLLRKQQDTALLISLIKEQRIDARQESRRTTVGAPRSYQTNKGVWLTK